MSVNKKLILAAAIAVGGVLYGCQNQTTPLEQFFKDFQRKIDRKTLAEFKSMEEDSLSNMYFLLSDQAWDALYANPDLNKQIDSTGVVQYHARIALLLVSYHRMLNNKDIQFFERAEKLREGYTALAEKNAKCDAEKIEVAKKTFGEWFVGDTLHLSFPVYYGPNGHRNASYYVCPSEYVSDTSEYFGLVGVVTNKEVLNLIDSTVVWHFFLKVVEKSDSETMLLLQNIKIGDTITVDLGDYGRLIK